MGLFDGDPAYERLKQTRESGWTGWVDQDGNKVEDADAWGRDQLAADNLDDGDQRSANH